MRTLRRQPFSAMFPDAILLPEDYDRWLGDELDPHGLLRSFPLRAYADVANINTREQAGERRSVDPRSAESACGLGCRDCLSSCSPSCPAVLLFPKKFVLLPQHGDDLIILRLQFRQDRHDQFGWSAFGKSRHHALHVPSDPPPYPGSEAMT